MPDPRHAPDPVEPVLLHRQERDRMLAALRAMLRRPMMAGRGGAGRAVAGLAADASPGAPLRALDNAVAAAALSLPALRAADPVLAAAPLAFLAALVEEERDDALPHAVAVPMDRVAIRRADPSDVRVETPWHVLTGDLTRGVLIQSLRGEDGDPGRAVRHTGNLVRLRPAGLWNRFRLGTKTPALDVEDAVMEAGVEAEGRGALLFHEGPLRLSGRHAGTIRYEYRVSPDDPVLRVAVILRAAPGYALGGARVSTALDDLSRTRPPMRGAAATAPQGVAGGSPRPTKGRAGFEEAWAGQSDLADPGSVEVLHLWTGDDGGEDPLSVHLRPREPGRVQALRAQAAEGAPHWVVLRHELGPIPAGGTARVEEDRLLLRGRVPTALTRAATRLRDPTASVEPGLTAHPLLLAALAEALTRTPMDAATARLRAWLSVALDRALAEAEPLHPALALAAEALHRASGERGAGRLGEIAARLGPVRDATGLLAAARLAPRGPALATALRDAPPLRAADPGELGNLPTLGLATRLRALRATEGTGLVPPEVTGPAIAACLDALSDRARPGGGALEVAAVAGTEGGDALSTAATLLALLAPEGRREEAPEGLPEKARVGASEGAAAMAVTEGATTAPSPWSAG